LNNSNELDISVITYKQDDIVSNNLKEAGYSNFKLYDTEPRSKQEYPDLLYTTSKLYAVIPRTVSDEYKLDFNSGIYLIDEQNIFTGIADDLGTSNTPHGLSYELTNDDVFVRDYSISLNMVSNKYSIKNIIYFVEYNYNYSYVPTSDRKYKPKEGLFLYCLPIKELLRCDNVMVLIPDYENIRKKELSKHNIRTPIGTFTSILKTDKDTIQDLYAKTFPERTKETVVPERSIVEKTGIITAGIVVLGIYLLLESNGIHFE
jgi:hypothetical protein